MYAMLKRIIYLILLSVLAFSCTEKMDLDLDVMEPAPVITGIISNEEQWVRLSTTSAYLNGESNTISNASVVVTDGMNSYTFQESLLEKGLYIVFPEISVKQHAEYKLKVEADFYGNGVRQEFYASSKVAATPQLDSITMQAMRMFDDIFWFVQVNYQEVSSSNSYLCRTFVNDDLEVGLDSYEIFDNRYGLGIYIYHKVVAVLFERPLTDEKVQVGDVVKVAFSGITKEYFDFLYSAKKETEGKNPIFSGPPANVKGNISNGALGMFTVYQSRSLSVSITSLDS